VLRVENLDPRNVIRSPHASDACCLTIAANGIAQPIVDRPRLDQSLDERLAVPQRKFQMLMFFDGTPRRVLQACQNEIRHRASLERSGMFDQTLLVGGYARLETFPTDTAGR